MTTVKNIYDYINSIAPFDTQEEWDNSGHLIGDFRKEVKTCVMALDATKKVCAFARDIGADLVLTHHPIIFGGISDVKSDSAVYTLANAGIAALCAHTNYDAANGGINDSLAAILGLKNVVHLEDTLIVKGELDTQMSIDDFAEYVSDTLDCAGIRYTDTEKTIQTVALGGGACEEYTELACQNADVFITGDMKYHAMLDATENGYAVISAGHFETEYTAFMMLKKKLEELFTDVEFIDAKQTNSIKTV
ncbi:MAG: Nif3-like dinuclear metal center hexameric protein [Ruminococcaceae bacterium]|nr:Nif3-like dinuclear metal center hexameric protein [Oscillospiraceae bacterium]